MKKFMLASVGAVLCLYAEAQNKNNKPLTIGDTVPSVTFTNLYNYPAKTASLSSFRGKVVIIDFWSVWCNSCIKEFPHFETLQKEFGDKLRFILLTAEPSATVNDAKKRIPILKKLQLPYGVSDTVFTKLFPHQVFPHSVWIDGSGKVIAITGSDQITSENIRNAINNVALNLPVKADVENYDPSKTLLKNAPATVLLKNGSKVILTTAIPGLPSTDKRWQEQGSIKRTYINKTLLQLLEIATGFTKDRIRLNAERLPFFTENGRNLKYCYEMVTPEDAPDSMVAAGMLRDLLQHFKLSLAKEIKPVPYYSLQVTDKKLIPHTKGGTSVTAVGSVDDPKKLINAPMAALTGIIDMEAAAHPGTPLCVDETGYLKNVDLVLPVKDFLSLGELNQALKRYGLVIKEATRSQEVLVVSNATIKKN